MATPNFTMPSWMANLRSYEADDPTIALRNPRTGGGAVPGRIHGTTYAQDAATLKEWEHPGYMAAANRKMADEDLQGSVDRNVSTDNLLRSQMGVYRQGQRRVGGDGKMWQYDALKGHGVPAEEGAASAPAAKTEKPWWGFGGKAEAPPVSTPAVAAVPEVKHDALGQTESTSSDPAFLQAKAHVFSQSKRGKAQKTALQALAKQFKR